jgi:hypothetical protein
MIGKASLLRPTPAAIICALLIASCSDGSKPPLVSRQRVEHAHGLKLPPSARNFQQKRHGSFLDHGIVSLFEIDDSEVRPFIAQLKIKSRNQPAIPGVGDPCINGWNVWPKGSATFVPGNEELDGLRPTWKGEVKPIEMLSCASSKGDWLHVEIWSASDHTLIKIYTNWN